MIILALYRGIKEQTQSMSCIDDTFTLDKHKNIEREDKDFISQLISSPQRYYGS